jgi:hypothetical protein
MGREANCTCSWNGETARVKALLEPPEMILRGERRARIPFAKIKRLAVAGSELCFRFGADQVRLALGAAMAEKWKKAIETPPPTLAKKLGIAAGVKIRTIGTIDDDALREAISSAEIVTRGHADVVVARANTPAELKTALARSTPAVADGAALWIIYRKGPGHAINETDVRAAGLAAGIVDVKVASVSPELTGLKFVKRKNAR